MEEGTGDKVDAEVANRVSLSVGSRKPRFACMVIRCGLIGGATGMSYAGGDG
jgi:hypothetical protein